MGLLENGLYFRRADKFRDTFEGTLSRATILERRNEPHQSATGVDHLIEDFLNARSRMFLNCWSHSDHESAALWDVYLQSNEGVALKSTYGRLAGVLAPSPLTIAISKINYVDYEQTPFFTANIFDPYLHKRLSFEHENEIRAIICTHNIGDNAQLIPAEDDSVTVPIAVDELVEAVYVSPAAPEWFGDIIEQVINRYGLSIPVIRSTLYDRPIY